MLAWEIEGSTTQLGNSMVLALLATLDVAFTLILSDAGGTSTVEISLILKLALLVFNIDTHAEYSHNHSKHNHGHDDQKEPS